MIALNYGGDELLEVALDIDSAQPKIAADEIHSVRNSLFGIFEAKGLSQPPGREVLRRKEFDPEGFLQGRPGIWRKQGTLRGKGSGQMIQSGLGKDGQPG